MHSLRVLRGVVDEGSSLKADGSVSRSLRWRIIGLLCFAAIVQKSDDALMGGMLRTFEEDFSVSASALSLLVMCSGLAQALCSFLWGWAADTQPRDLILMAGATWWGLATILAGSATAFWVLCVGRALTGMALGAVLPVSQSMVADIVPVSQLGTYFSYITSCGGAGGFIGQLVATSVSEEWVGGVGRVRGWRIVLWSIGALSLLLALAVYFFGADPGWAVRRRAKLKGGGGAQVGHVGTYLRYVCGVPTFLLIALQGISGAVPWSCLSGFGTIFLQCVPHHKPPPSAHSTTAPLLHRSTQPCLIAHGTTFGRPLCPTSPYPL